MARQRAAATKKVAAPPHLKERLNFKALLLENPNFFGTAPEQGAAKLTLKNDTAYEQLTCIGYNPALGQLEATVQIKLPTGYGGDLCQAGSAEHVRFFADLGSGWEDLGATGFIAHDIPNANDCAGHATKPLSYVVSLPWRPPGRFCAQPLLANVRAILSWENLPTPGDPNFEPIWGNHLDRHVQIAPRRFPFLSDVLDHLSTSGEATLSLPDDLAHLADVELQPPGPPPVLTLEQLVAANVKLPAAERVPPHRLVFEAVQAATAPGAFGTGPLGAFAGQLEAVDLDLSSIAGIIQKTSGDVTYEQLNCVGLDGSREVLGASFTIKRPTGYSGTLCQHGSTEYVAFWADWDDTCKWTYVGTAQVQVHDIAGIPADGLHYAAFMPAPQIDAHRQTCAEPRLSRIRAVLSWSTPPSTVDPDAIPHWGNRLDVHVQLPPGEPTKPLDPNIRNIGGIAVEDIDYGAGGTGMTRTGGTPVHFAHFTTSIVDPLQRACPFGGQVIVEGRYWLGYKYRVSVRRPSQPPSAAIWLTRDFWVERSTSGYSHQVVGPDGFFTYLDPAQHMDFTLALWDTVGDDQWLVRLEIRDLADVTVGTSPDYLIQLDNTAPFVDIEITSPGGDCADFAQGTTVQGLFVATDLHFGSWGLLTRPNTAAIPSNPPVADAGLAPTSETPPRVPPPPALPPWTGGHGWSLNTTTPVQMRPCGYVAEVSASDRSILNSHPDYHNTNTTDTGLCLRKP